MFSKPNESFLALMFKGTPVRLQEMPLNIVRKYSSLHTCQLHIKHKQIASYNLQTHISGVSITFEVHVHVTAS